MQHWALIADVETLSTGGWIMMIGCIGSVCALAAFCFYRVLRDPNPSQRHHAPPGIDTHDLDS